MLPALLVLKVLPVLQAVPQVLPDLPVPQVFKALQVLPVLRETTALQAPLALKVLRV